MRDEDIRSQTFLLGDLFGILRGVARAGRRPTPRGAYANGWDDGFRAAIESVAEAIGIRVDVPAPSREQRITVRRR